MQLAGLVLLVCAFLSARLFHNRGRHWAAGFSLGLCLGVIGLFIAFIFPASEEGIERMKEAKEHRAISQGTMQRCPACAEVIKVQATSCRYCGAILN